MTYTYCIIVANDFRLCVFLCILHTYKDAGNSVFEIKDSYVYEWNVVARPGRISV